VFVACAGILGKDLSEIGCWWSVIAVILNFLTIGLLVFLAKRNPLPIMVGHALLSKRFDRTSDGRRIHFASAMTLLGLTDGSDAQTGNGYLDIVDFILQNCCDVEQNLRQLYRRVAFNIAIGNSDDHFRNHGFLLTPRGWTLSPAYDMNPTLNEYQALLINSTTNHADLQVLLDSSEEYMIGKDEAVRIIDEVKAGVKHWKSIATRLGIAKREMDVFEQVFQRSLK
jgi:serine/threonine-protein kinase HipA